MKRIPLFLTIALVAAPWSFTKGATTKQTAHFPSLMKRSAPKPVEPVVADGVEYSAPSAAMGCVVATDKATGKELWRARIYNIERVPGLEGDVQDVFITKLQLDGARLKITDDRERQFSLDLKTHEAAPVPKR